MGGQGAVDLLQLWGPWSYVPQDIEGNHDNHMRNNSSSNDRSNNDTVEGLGCTTLRKSKKLILYLGMLWPGLRLGPLDLPGDSSTAKGTYRVCSYLRLEATNTKLWLLNCRSSRDPGIGCNISSALMRESLCLLGSCRH